MKLQSFRVQNFRSVIDSTEIRVSDVTVLIGPNQAGKSSILQGLDKLSFDAEFDVFDLTQLRGIYKAHIDGEVGASELPIATGTFILTEDEVSRLKNILVDVSDVPSTISVTKTFDNWYRFEIGSTRIAFPGRTLVESGVDELSTKVQELETWVQPHLQRSPNNQFAGSLSSALNEAKKALKEKPPLSTVVANKLTEATAQQWDAQFKTELLPRIKSLSEFAHANFPEDARSRDLYSFFISALPRTAYFKTYDRLEDEAPIADLAKASEQHRTFRNLLKLADLRVDTLGRIPDEKQKQAYIENASGKVTKLLQQAWKQEQLQVQFRTSQGKLMVFTKDSTAVETLLPPSSGSEGFQWWLGFYISFGASTNSEYKNAILLLDDPGVFLHPTGDKDLLQLFEDYRAYNVTTIYTTQIPFLIPRDKLDRLRLVKKDQAGLSTVDEKFYRGHDSDVLAPVRAALGVTLGDSLFAGELTIVTEGLSDMVLLYAILKELDRRGVRKIIDIDKIQILGGTGAQSIQNLALLLQIQNLPYVVLLDNDEEGRRVRASLPKQGIPEERLVMVPLPEEGNQTHADIEDVFPLEMFAAAFYQVHGKQINMTQAQVLSELSKGNEKVCNRAKSILRQAGSKYDLEKTSIAYELAARMERATALPAEFTNTISSLIDHIGREVKLYRD